jgi:T5SS/PEP-CTERM-associated repeat protein
MTKVPIHASAGRDRHGNGPEGSDGERQHGVVTATGAGSNLIVTGTATVGDMGKGTLLALSGATFSAADGTLGRSAGGKGGLLVGDPGSVATLANTLVAGDA